MDEQKKARQALTIIQQSITEYMRDLKQKLKIAMLKKDLKTASGIEAALSRIEESPKTFEIVHVSEGDEQEFRDILDKYGVANFYINASYMEQYNGSWLIPKDQWEELDSQHLFKTVQETRTVMLDENNIESPDQTTILRLKTTISLAEKEAVEYGDDDGREYLLSLLEDIVKCEPAAIVHPLGGKEAEFAHRLDASKEPYIQIHSQYLPTYTGTYVVSENLYKQLASEQLIATEEDLNQDERELGTKEDDQEKENKEKEISQEEENSTAVTPQADKMEKKEGQKSKQPESESPLSEIIEEPQPQTIEQSNIDHNDNETSQQNDAPKSYEPTQEQVVENSEVSSHGQTELNFDSLEQQQNIESYDVIDIEEDLGIQHVHESTFSEALEESAKEQNTTEYINAEQFININEQKFDSESHDSYKDHNISFVNIEDKTYHPSLQPEEPDHQKPKYELEKTTSPSDSYAPEITTEKEQKNEFYIPPEDNKSEIQDNLNDQYSHSMQESYSESQISQYKNSSGHENLYQETLSYEQRKEPIQGEHNRIAPEPVPIQDDKYENSVTYDNKEVSYVQNLDYTEKFLDNNYNATQSDTYIETSKTYIQDQPAVTADKLRSSYEESSSPFDSFSIQIDRKKEAETQPPLSISENGTEAYSIIHNDFGQKEKQQLDHNVLFENRDTKVFEKTDYVQQLQQSETDNIQDTTFRDFQHDYIPADSTKSNELTNNLFEKYEQQGVNQKQGIEIPQTSRRKETDNFNITSPVHDHTAHDSNKSSEEDEHSQIIKDELHPAFVLNKPQETQSISQESGTDYFYSKQNDSLSSTQDITDIKQAQTSRLQSDTGTQKNPQQSDADNQNVYSSIYSHILSDSKLSKEDRLNQETNGIAERVFTSKKNQEAQSISDRPETDYFHLNVDPLPPQSQQRNGKVSQESPAPVHNYNTFNTRQPQKIKPQTDIEIPQVPQQSTADNQSVYSSVYNHILPDLKTSGTSYNQTENNESEHPFVLNKPKEIQPSSDRPETTYFHLNADPRQQDKKTDQQNHDSIDQQASKEKSIEVSQGLHHGKAEHPNMHSPIYKDTLSVSRPCEKDSHGQVTKNELQKEFASSNNKTNIHINAGKQQYSDSKHPESPLPVQDHDVFGTKLDKHITSDNSNANGQKSFVKGSTLNRDTSKNKLTGDKAVAKSEEQKANEKLKNLTVSKDTLTKAVFVGHHDMFEKTAFKATFSSVEETDLHRSMDVFRNEGFVNTLRAANAMAVSTMLTQDVTKMINSLDKSQLDALSKLISKNNCGTFNLEDPEKYQGSMKALHNYMARVGVLEKRSISNGGALMYALDENGKVYEGNILDRRAAKKQDNLVQQKMKRDLKEKQKAMKEAGSAGATAVNPSESINDIVAKNAKHTKKIIQKNKERTLEILKKDLGRAGLDENQANSLLKFMYKNNKRFASTSRVMSIADKGKSKILTLNPLKNSLTAKGIKEDANARYIYRVQSMAAGTQAFYHAGTMIAKSVYDKQMASVARALNKVDTKLTKTGLDQTAKDRLQKRSQILKQKQTKLKNKGEKWSSRQKKFESGLKKVQDTFIKKPQEAIKKPFKGIRHEAQKVGGQIPGIRRIVNFRWATFTKNHTFASKIISAPFTIYSNATGWIASKIIIPLLGILGHILIFMLVIAVGGGLIATSSMMLQSMFSNEPGMNDPVTAEEIMASTMGLVYNELQIEETAWANGLMHSADGETIRINDIKYSKMDEGTGTIDEQYHDVDASTYIRDVLGLKYDDATDTIITPEPWVGAPSEACHTADGNITGGVELRFVGLGGYPAYTSNIMEIISMASVASDDSTLVEYDDETISEASDASFIGKIGGFASGILKGFKFATNTLSNFANNIISSIPGGQDFMNHYESKKRAKVFYSYSKPLFNLSHQTAYGLEFSFLPTDRTLGFSGASSMNQFYNNLWSGEGYAGLSEVADAEVPRQVWKFLKEHGFDDIHAAGVMGNFYQESKFNPNLVESNGEGIGLGQWSFGRKTALRSFALKETGSQEGWRNNVDLQLRFMILADEIQTVRKYLSANFSSVAESAYWWGHYWERFNESDGSMTAVRIPAAAKYYELYAGKTSFENNNSTSSGETTGNADGNPTVNNVKKYSHTPNIDDNGIANGVYKNNLKYQDSVKIDNAKSIKVEIWYSTEKNYDWLNVRGQEQGPLSNWDDGNKIYTDGNKTEKPDDNDEIYHQILILEGDTVFFSFKSDRSIGRYGYYAIVTADQMTADTSWLEDQNNVTANMPNILVNANVCSGHNGHGCQSYSHFGYGDNSRLYMEYNGTRIDTVYPAALDSTVSNGEVVCSVPSGSGSDFYTAIDHNPDCWSGELRSTQTSSGSGLHTKGGSSYFDEKTDYGYEVTSGNSHQFYVTITVDEWDDDDEDDSDTYHTNEYWVFTHECNQQHTGYYCGGHLRLIIYGLIYHMTPAERANTHELYTSKTDVLEYKKGYPSSHFGSEDSLADKNLIKNAEDLFDIDMAIYHVKKSVSDEFPGWSYDYMDMATLKLESDWNELYGIKASWTINGINAGGNTGSTLLSNGDISEILSNARSQYPHDGTDTIRDQAIQTAIQFVGKIGYSQAHHSDPLRVGGYSDCSGFVSQIYHDVLRQVYNTDGFEALAKRYRAYRNFTDGNCKPGDILLHGMDTPQHNDNHALLYTGIVNGTIQSIDCSTSGGVGSVFYRSRGAAYYNGCTYIDMTVFINGYLADHPELKENIYPDNNTVNNNEST